MSWGDSWGDGPGASVKALAKAFHEGRELKNSAGRVRRCYASCVLEYSCRGNTIARHTPQAWIPEIVADKLCGNLFSIEPFVFRTVRADRCEARHLRALGVEAQWQWGGCPFLLYGAHVEGWTTIEQAKAMPKWAPAPPKPRRERFVNMTLPLEFT